MVSVPWDARWIWLYSCFALSVSRLLAALLLTLLQSAAVFPTHLSCADFFATAVVLLAALGYGMMVACGAGEALPGLWFLITMACQHH